MTAQRVVIVGGGIAGLSAAWYVQREAARAGLEVALTVLEASDRWGGKVLTEHVDGLADEPFVVEGGPDSFMTQKPWAMELARELGLGDRLLGTNDRKRSTYVLVRGKPIPLPEGVMLIVPTRLKPFALSPLISPLGKLRMALDLFIPARRDEEDETLAEFVTRRLGAEALDKIAEPLMSGIYNADPTLQSVQATFPRFHQIEREHGSLIRGMLAARKPSAARPLGQPKSRVPMFMSLLGGTQELIDALVRGIQGDLRLGASVSSVERSQAGFSVTTAAGETLSADAVILTTPARVSAQLVAAFAPEAAAGLRAIRYLSTGAISLAYAAGQIQRPLPGFGLVIPRSERRPINAITISSTKFDHRAPAGYALLRVFFGGSRSPETMDAGDDALLDLVRNELRSILGIEDAPLFHRIFRWRGANPQYDRGHLGRITAIEAALPPGLGIAGSALRGVGLPDCIHQSHQTAERVIAQIQQAHTFSIEAAP